MKLNSFLFLLICCLLTAGCYHIGTPGGAPVAVGRITLLNKTHEPALASLFKQLLNEQISQTPGIDSSRRDNALELVIDLSEIHNTSVARAEARNRASRDRNSEAYQTVLNRVELTVFVKAISPDGKTVLDATFKGQGDIPLMHDDFLPFQAALRQASRDVADQLVDSLAELHL